MLCLWFIIFQHLVLSEPSPQGTICLRTFKADYSAIVVFYYSLYVRFPHCRFFMLLAKSLRLPPGFVKIIYTSFFSALKTEFVIE